MLSLTLIFGAFAAGILMFLAPCTLPIVPGYLAFIAGERKRVMRNALAFVLGFSVVFIVLGASAGLFGIIVGPWRYALGQLGGALIILFGLTMLGLLRIPFLSGERHIKLPKYITVGNPSSSLLIGVLFALGWSPCIGPILGTILFFASSSATALSGALLLTVFSAGLALPFILTALLLSHAQSIVVHAGKVSRVLSVVGGIFLILIGTAMLLGMQGQLVAWAYGALDVVGYDRLLNYL